MMRSKKAIFLPLLLILLFLLAGTAAAVSDTYDGITFHPFTLDAGNNTCVPWEESPGQQTRNCDPVNLVFPDQTAGQIFAALQAQGWSVPFLATDQWLHFDTADLVMQESQLAKTVNSTRYHVRLWQVPGQGKALGAVHGETQLFHTINTHWEDAEALLAADLCGLDYACTSSDLLPEQLNIQDLDPDNDPDTWRDWGSDGRLTVIAANSPPIASFTYACAALDCDFDAAASDDPGGTIVDYAWDFGDGQIGSGVVISNTYAAGGTYTVTLTVTDDQGATGEDAQGVQVSSDPPAAPVPLAPAGAVFSPTITYEWGEVAAALDYQILVIDQDSNQVHKQWYLAGDVCSGGLCSLVEPAALPEGLYNWYVKARNAAGGTQSPATWFHKAAEAPPAVPNLRQPSGTISGTLPVYLWDHVGGAVEYQIRVLDRQNNPVLDTWLQALHVCNGSLCSTPQPAPLTEQGYTWYIRARNPYGFAWSSGKLFTVFSGVRPLSPNPLSPTGVISDTFPAYTWSDGSDVHEYMLLVVDSQRNREVHAWYPIAEICDGTTCAVDQPLPLPEDNYNWYLKARNPAGSAWGIGQRFTVFTGEFPGPATPISPTGVIGDSTPTYSWNIGTDAVDYQLLLFDGTGSLILNAWFLGSDICSAGFCSATPGLNLPQGNYSWQLKSRNPLGAVWSSRLDFSLAATGAGGE